MNHEVTSPIKKTPLFTIITVCYNTEGTIKSTVNSVSRQTFRSFEFIIIDGGSTDGTVERIRESQDYIDYWCSEPDRGVYHAMNKGIDKSCGQWIIFLGADDKFCDEFVLDKVAKKLLHSSDNELKMIYGDTLYENGTNFKSEVSRKILWKNTVQHQSAFYKNSLFNSFKYNDSLRICSDYELNLLLFINNEKTQYIDIPIAICGCNGLSSDFKNRSRAINELNTIRGWHINSLLSMYISLILYVRLMLKLSIYYITSHVSISSR